MTRDSVVTLGFISGLSGVYGWMAKDQLAGVELAVEKINQAGGIAGRRVTLVTRDDKSDPHLSTSETHALIHEDHADMIIGSLSAGTHLFINNETKQAGKLFMSIGQSQEITMAPHLGPYTFHEAFTPYMSVHGMGTWIFKNLGTRWVIVMADYQWGQQALKAYQELASRLSATILDVITIPFPAKEPSQFSTHFPRILAQKPDVLIGNNYGTDQLMFIETANQAHLRYKMSIAFTISEINVIGRIDPINAVGMYWGTNFYWQLADLLPAAQEFVARYRRRYRRVPSGYSAYGYSGALEILEQAHTIGTFPIDSTKIATELEGRSYAHYKDHQWWRPCDHQSFQDYYIMKLKGPEERKHADDSSEIIGVTKWDIDMERSCNEIGHDKHLWGHAAPIQR